MTPKSCVAQPTIEQVNQAFDIADKAAANGLVELSMRAVTRALNSGPPVVSTATDKPTLQHLGARIDTSRAVPPTSKEAIDRRIRYTTLRLAEQWGETASAVQVYEAIREIILPAGRPSDAFLYGFPLEVDPLQPDRLPTAKSLAGLLVKWANKAERLNDLHANVKSRDLANSTPGLLLGLLISLEMQNEEDTDYYHAQVSERMTDGDTRQAAELTAIAGITYHQAGRRLDVAANLLELSGITLQKIDTAAGRQDSPCSAILLTAARCWFSIGKIESGVKMLKQYLQESPEKNGSNTVLSRHVDVVGSELFSRGLVDQARALLGEDVAVVYERRYQMFAQPDSVESPPPFRERNVQLDGRLATINAVETSEFSTQLANQIWVCQLDLATKSSTLLFTLPDFHHADSPVVSPDGTTVAFDATFPGEAITSDGRIYVAKLDGSRIDCLGRGCSPSWSPAGKRLAYSAYLPTRGVWIMRSSGEDARLIDRLGWSGRWSPDGRMVAYTRLVDRRWDVIVYDLVENEYFSVFGETGCPFANVFPDFTWSADSSELLLRVAGGNAPGDAGFKVVSIQVLSGRVQTIVESGYRFGDQLSCSSQGMIVLVENHSKNNPEQLFGMDVAAKLKPKKLTGQFETRRNIGASWMPDGQSLIYISKPAKN